MRVKLKNSRQIIDKINKRFAGYDIEVGILKDGPHYSARRGAPGKKGQDVRSSYAGGPVRRKSRQSSMSISEVSKANRERMGFNYLSEPFRKTTHESGSETASSRGNSNIRKFARAFIKAAMSNNANLKRVENLLQAVVRNPILRGEYSNSKPLTVRIKGFDRYMIDTGQLFKSIKARIRKKGRK